MLKWLTLSNGYMILRPYIEDLPEEWTIDLVPSYWLAL